MKERETKQVGQGRSRHRVIGDGVQKPFNRRAIDHRRRIKKRIASKELKLLRISFSQMNKNESLLSVDGMKEKKERKIKREKWKNREK